jgi:hypothetical protein
VFPRRGKFLIRHSLIHDAHPNLVAWEEGWVLGVMTPVVGLLVLILVVLVVVVCNLSCPELRVAEISQVFCKGCLLNMFVARVLLTLPEWHSGIVTKNGFKWR